MSRLKSIWTFAGGGSLLSSSSAGGASAGNASHDKRARGPSPLEPPPRPSGARAAPLALNRAPRLLWPCSLGCLHHASRFNASVPMRHPTYLSRTSTFDPCTAVWHPEDQQAPILK